jgi:hypothetical protein
MAKVIEEAGVRFSDPDDLKNQIQEYVKLKKTTELMEARQKELREKLFAKIEELGEEDDKGNIFLGLDQEIDGIAALEKQRRVKRKIDDAIARQIIEEHNLEDDLFKTIEVVDEDALMAAHWEGKISEAELEAMFPATVVWALMTKKA